jgi:hypothetical protein
LPHYVQCSAPYPLYRLKTPSQQIAVVFSALAEGLDASAAERVFGYQQATITTWLARAGRHAQTLHEQCTKILPVLQLGPRTQHMAHLLIHSLRQMLAPGCLPLFTNDGLNVYFYAARGPFWTLAPGESPRAAWTSVAGGDGSDLRPGEEKLLAAQAGS